jgi:hypothetical protein
VKVALTSIAPVQGVATIPGEIAGPALRVGVEITNDTSAAVDLTATVVNLYYGAQATPALTLTEPGASPLPASVAPGASAKGVWVFTVPTDQRDAVKIEVDLEADVSVVLFSGPVS